MTSRFADHRVSLRDAIYGASFAPEAVEERRLGAEVELLVVDHTTRRPLSLFGKNGVIDALRRYAPAAGWREFTGYDGIPRFDVPTRGTISFEPGGQIEFSSVAFRSASELVRALHDTVFPLRTWCNDHGIALESIGIDPLNRAEDIPLQLDVDRYKRMTAHFDSIGPFGIRMMRQTAAIQVSLDRGREPAARWRLLNDLAPYVIAIFANSPNYAGEATGHRSFRAHCWRQLDSGRTGMAQQSDDPAGAYTDFALGAADILDAGWDAHLTTLFPEVRPRGHFEVRSCDAIDPKWYAAPIVFLAGLAYDARASMEASLLAADSRALLRIAGEQGLTDPAIARTARDLFQLALDGAKRLGETYIGGEELSVAAEYYHRYTARGQSLASDAANFLRMRTVRSRSSRV